MGGINNKILASLFKQEETDSLIATLPEVK
jgi:hypothetical protein